MRYALISDIHGNLDALNTVLADAKHRNIDRYIFLGDYSICLPYANEIVDTIKSIDNKYVIKGNHEEYLERDYLKDKSTWYKGQLNTLYWVYETLSSENKDYLASLPLKKTISDNNTSIFAFHSIKEYFNNTLICRVTSGEYAIYERDNKSTFNEYISKIKTDLQNDKVFNNVLAELPDGVYVYGHNHLQMNIKMDNKLLVNPGSCGLPLDQQGFAPYSILDIQRDSQSVEEFRIPYDIETTIQKYRESELYREARVFCEVVIKQLLTGRECFRFFINFAEEYAKSIKDDLRPFRQDTFEKAFEAWDAI